LDEKHEESSATFFAIDLQGVSSVGWLVNNRKSAEA
jgi:hypothetical protein